MGLFFYDAVRSPVGLRGESLIEDFDVLRVAGTVVFFMEKVVLSTAEFQRLTANPEFHQAYFDFGIFAPPAGNTFIVAVYGKQVFEPKAHIATFGNIRLFSAVAFTEKAGQYRNSKCVEFIANSSGKRRELSDFGGKDLPGSFGGEKGPTSAGKPAVASIF